MDREGGGSGDYKLLPIQRGATALQESSSRRTATVWIDRNKIRRAPVSNVEQGGRGWVNSKERSLLRDILKYLAFWQIISSLCWIEE